MVFLIKGVGESFFGAWRIVGLKIPNTLRLRAGSVKQSFELGYLP